MTPITPHASPGRGDSYEMVDTEQALERLCTALAQAPVIGLDTEFERSHTFFARLALLQVDDGEHGYLIDPMALPRLDPLAEFLANFPRPVIMHAPMEDLEIFERCLGQLPRNLFDSQLAAALCGRGWGLGYDRLVDQLFGIEVSKTATRSDWLRRPLSPAQLHYAAMDVRYLPQSYELLGGELDSKGRRAWLAEEIDHLIRRMREPEARRDFAKLGRRLGSDDDGLRRLFALCQWREAQARERNQPRRRIMDDALLSQCAQLPPATKAEFRQRSERLNHRSRLPEGTLFEAVQACVTAPEVDRPVEAEDLRPYRDQLSRMKSAVSQVAAELGLPGELLAPKRLLEQLLVLRLIRRQSPPPEFLGWRADTVLPELLEILDR